jgi:hypothetical protein
MRNTVTTVRFSEEEGRKALSAYLFGGRYGPRRVPRGIEPAVVSKFLVEKIASTDDEELLAKALDIARFYETKEVAPAAAKHFTKPMGQISELVFHIRAVELAADLGATEQAVEATRHFENRVVPHPKSVFEPSLLMETAKVTEPNGGLGAVERRLQQEKAQLEPAQRRSEPDMMAFDKIAAALRNDLPRARKVTDYKARLLGMPPAERKEPVIRVYMDEASVVDDYLRIRAARLLRQDVFDGAIAAPIPEFRALALGFKEEQLRANPVAAGRFWRAERAYRYFGGAPDHQMQQLGKATTVKTDDFLDDDE